MIDAVQNRRVTPLGMRNGIPFYGSNPSVMDVNTSQKHIALSFGFLKRMANLTSAGKSVLEMLLEQVQKAERTDKTVLLKFHHYKNSGISERTFSRGVRDLIDSELIFPSEIDGLFVPHKDIQWKDEVTHTSMKSGFIYLLHDDASNLTKIGCTTKENGTRQRAIMGGHPTVLVNVLTVEVGDCFAAEAKCHKHFAKHRRNGEWFDAPLVTIEKYIQKHIQSQSCPPTAARQ